MFVHIVLLWTSSRLRGVCPGSSKGIILYLNEVKTLEFNHLLNPIKSFSYSFSAFSLLVIANK